MKPHPTSVRLHTHLEDRLNELSALTGLSMNRLINQAIYSYFEDMDKTGDLKITPLERQSIDKHNKIGNDKGKVSK